MGICVDKNRWNQWNLWGNKTLCLFVEFLPESPPHAGNVITAMW